jgi:Ca2+:H+ antiporter
VEPIHTGGGHDAPNWSKAKSSIILLGATVLYAIIAEILVNTVDVVLESVDIDEKFLGITLFALVPNTTEFLVSRTNRHGDEMLTSGRTLFHLP